MPLRLSEPARRVVWITPDNSAERNAIMRELGAVRDSLAASGDCRAIVITRADTNGFSADANTAMDLILTGRLVDAEFAAGINLINRVCAPDNVLPQAIETATQIAANSPAAVQAVKRQISEGIAEYAQNREERDQQLGDDVRASPHFAEGVAAFREKRAPDYG